MSSILLENWFDYEMNNRLDINLLDSIIESNIEEIDKIFNAIDVCNENGIITNINEGVIDKIKDIIDKLIEKVNAIIKWIKDKISGRMKKDKESKDTNDKDKESEITITKELWFKFVHIVEDDTGKPINDRGEEEFSTISDLKQYVLGTNLASNEEERIQQLKDGISKLDNLKTKRYHIGKKFSSENFYKNVNDAEDYAYKIKKQMSADIFDEAKKELEDVKKTLNMLKEASKMKEEKGTESLYITVAIKFYTKYIAFIQRYVSDCDEAEASFLFVRNRFFDD